MGNSKVDRATSDMLIGPDWAMNVEICDICNRDPVQAKDIVKGIKRRLGSKNPKVQLLSLTLLETIVKNCGEVVHAYVAEKDVLREMVKIVKKKPDFHVKEKVLVLIDTWQEAFGGPRARYPQYFVAYQDLLRLGAVFPQRSEGSAPVLTPPQTHPLTSYPQNLRNPESRQDAAESSVESEFPTLSLTEIQNARGIMDVLAEMLSAVDPGNKEVPQVGVSNLQPMPNGLYPQGLQHTANNQVGGMYFQPMSAINNQTIPSNQMVGFHPQANPGLQPMGMFPQPMQSGQMAYMYPQQIYGNPMAAYVHGQQQNAYGYGQQQNAYGYGQQQNFQILEQNMSGLSLRDHSVMKNSSFPVSTLSNGPSGKPSKPEDKLFGDLVDISKFKPTKTLKG
ncbi:TOM1 2 [Olea europaea subsp. europaea]|uniref:TOM1 2 n=1 Tax=Olea europaea subsp. europaea TaxID=158383 RepID=A0A8S0TRQ0_OLEEU|nr:TOM1 2 [Olea europaea subsp. europaea]